MGHKGSLNKFQKFGIIENTLFDHGAIFRKQ